MGVPGRMSRGKTDMQHLLISIRLPEGHWAGDITREDIAFCYVWMSIWLSLLDVDLAQ